MRNFIHVFYFKVIKICKHECICRVSGLIPKSSRILILISTEITVQLIYMTNPSVLGFVEWIQISKAIQRLLPRGHSVLYANYLNFIGYHNPTETVCISKLSKSYDPLSNINSRCSNVCTISSITCSKGWLICSSWRWAWAFICCIRD